MKKTAIPLVALAGVLAVAGCSSESAPTPKTKTGEDIANGRQNVQLQNDVEGKNYNRRLTLADNPASLIWCTAYPTSPNAKAFTVPIVGKLTSGNKRPTPTEKVRIDTDTLGSEYNPELPGPDGMYGTSGEYRYGFDPAGNYHDFYNIETYCTTVPTIVQKETTQIAISVDGNLSSIDKKVEAALAECQKSNKDQTVACPKAAQILGVN